MSTPRLPSIDLGPLPVDIINAALGTELEPGRARLSTAAHAHMAADHPGDYAACLAALPDAVSAPSFIGQAPGHTRNFELVRRIGRPDGQVVLVAVAIDLDEAVEYRVRSCYLISAETVDQRRRAGRLKAVLPT